MPRSASQTSGWLAWQEVLFLAALCVCRSFAMESGRCEKKVAQNLSRRCRWGLHPLILSNLLIQHQHLARALLVSFLRCTMDPNQELEWEREGRGGKREIAPSVVVQKVQSANPQKRAGIGRGSRRSGSAQGSRFRFQHACLCQRIRWPPMSESSKWVNSLVVKPDNDKPRDQRP